MSTDLRSVSLILPILFMTAGCAGIGAADGGPHIAWPDKADVRNVLDYGATPDDGVDDTAAFNQALAEGGPHAEFTVYVPNGRYLLSDTVKWGRRRTLVGQTRSGVVLKLADNAQGFGNADEPRFVIETAASGPFYGNDSRANAAFANYVRNLTIDVGSGNPGATGIGYITHNTGLVEHVTVRAPQTSGAIGIDMSVTEFGPGMLRDVRIEGFDIGIKTSSNVSHTTMERITLHHQRELGMLVRQPVSVHRLTSVNAATAIRVTVDSLAQLVLVDADLTGGAADATAIDCDGTASMHRVAFGGYGVGLAPRDGDPVPGAQTLHHYTTGTIETLGAAPKRHLDLPIEATPPTFRQTPDKWLVVERRDGDMTDALQKALDSGAPTIFLQGKGRFNISRPLTVPPTVRRILSVTSAAIHGAKDAKMHDRPHLRIVSQTNHPLTIERINLSSWPQITHAIEIDSPRPIVLNNAGSGHPGGYVTNTEASAGGCLFGIEPQVELRIGGDYHVYFRQWNPENNPFLRNKSNAQRTYLVNRGAAVWVLGMKTEAPAIHAVTTDGGRTEVLGGFFRDHFGGYDVPYFRVDRRSVVSASYVQFAWQHGKARSLQADVIDGPQITHAPATFRMDLLRIGQTRD